jgi:hypothetical protein
VHIEKTCVAGVDAGAKIRVGLIRGAKANRVCLGERSIKRWAGGRAGENAYLEWFPALCAASAFAATARGMAFGEPAGVKPLNATVCPCFNWAAASSAVSLGNGKPIGSPLEMVLHRGSEVYFLPLHRGSAIRLMAKREHGTRRSCKHLRIAITTSPGQHRCDLQLRQPLSMHW